MPRRVARLGCWNGRPSFRVGRAMIALGSSALGTGATIMPVPVAALRLARAHLLCRHDRLFIRIFVGGVSSCFVGGVSSCLQLAAGGADNTHLTRTISVRGADACLHAHQRVCIGACLCIHLERNSRQLCDGDGGHFLGSVDRGDECRLQDSDCQVVPGGIGAELHANGHFVELRRGGGGGGGGGGRRRRRRRRRPWGHAWWKRRVGRGRGRWWTRWL